MGRINEAERFSFWYVFLDLSSNFRDGIRLVLNYIALVVRKDLDILLEKTQRIQRI
jgi:hypothetical protein